MAQLGGFGTGVQPPAPQMIGLPGFSVSSGDNQRRAVAGLPHEPAR
jgi:hypothetical protein